MAMAIATPIECPADVTGDGKLCFFDIQLFLAAFAVQQPPSDWNADGVFNFFDL